MFYFSLAALVVVSGLYREELGLKALLVYWIVWAAFLAGIFLSRLPLAYLATVQAILAIIMLIQLRVNPEI